VSKLASKVQKAKAIVFDVDGVILESSKIKDDAFIKAFAAIGCNELEAVASIHRKLYGVNRVSQFQKIYQVVYNTEIEKTALEKLNHNFESWVVGQLNKCPLVNGVKELRQKKKLRAFYTASAAPQKEVIKQMRRRKIDTYFNGIFGGPAKKVDIFRSLIKTDRMVNEHSVFIGDRISDFRSAEKVGLPFIGRVKPGDENPFPENVTIITDLTEIADCL